MIPVFGSIAAFLGGWFARLVGNSIVRFYALKAMLWFLFITVLPVVIYNVLSWFLSDVLSFASAQLAGAGASSVVVELTGAMGFLAVHLRIPESFSVLISAFVTRATISMIPFVGRGF